MICGCYIKRKSVSLYLLLPCIFRVSEKMQGNCNVDRTHRSSCASRVAPKSGAGTFGQILIQSGWVLLLYQSIPSGRLGWISHHSALPCTFYYVHTYIQYNTTLHAGMIRTDTTNDALHLEHGKPWTKRCRGLCQLLFILVRYSYCCLFFWEGSTTGTRGGEHCALIWAVSNVLMSQVCE